MATKDLYRFDELAESCGNRYLAIRFIAKWSRSLGKQYAEYQIIESKLIQWVITGRCPYIESELARRKVRTDDDKIEEFLSLISDKEVVKEVISTYKKSIKHRHLLECRNSSIGNGRNSRANVLLRMMWYTNTMGG